MLLSYCLEKHKPYPTLKNTEKAIGIIQAALGIGKRPVNRAKVTRSGDGVCELFIEGKNGAPGRKLDLRATSKLLLSEGGILKVTKNPPDSKPPRGGSELLLVMTSSKKDCCRVESWGYEEDLQDLQEGQTAIGSGLTHSTPVHQTTTSGNTSRLNDPRFQVKKPAVPVNRKRFVKQMLAGVTKKAV